jgi:hypothetical protein
MNICTLSDAVRSTRRRGILDDEKEKILASSDLTPLVFLMFSIPLEPILDSL